MSDSFLFSENNCVLRKKIGFVLDKNREIRNISGFFFYHSESDTTFESESDEKMSGESEADSQSDGRENKCELSFFPDEDKEEYIFFQKTLTAVKNWFTLFGWSKGQNPISVPYSLRW